MGAVRVRVKNRTRFPVLIALAAALGTVVSPGIARAEEPSHSRPSTPDIPKPTPDGLVVGSFENSGKLATLDWMRVGLPVALADKLAINPNVRVEGDELGIAAGKSFAWQDPAGITEVAGKYRAKWVVTGAFARTDWKLEVWIKLWRVETGVAPREVSSFHEIAEYPQTVPMLARGARTLLGGAGLPYPASTEAALTRPTSSDFYAFTLYGRGLYWLHGLGGAGDLAKADKNLARAVYIDPKMAEAHYALALVYLRQNQPAKARGRLTYALDLRDDQFAAVSMLARDAAAQKKRGEAIELAARALQLRPWDLGLRLLLGESYWEEGDVEGAYLELSRIVKVDPDHLPARRTLVLVHAARGHGVELAAELEQIVRLDPKDQAARLDLGAAYWSLGRDGDAIKVYESIVADNPKQLQALKFLGDIHRKRGEIGAAILWYEKALTANRNDPRPYFLLGSAYVEAGDDVKAIRIFKAAQRFPKYLAEAEANLGSIYLRTGDDAQALWYTRQAARKRPASPSVQFNYGLALSRHKQYDDALAAFTIASELDPYDADIRFAQGVALLRLGRLEAAEKAFQECLRLNPDHEDAMNNLQLIQELRRRANEGELAQPG